MSSELISINEPETPFEVEVLHEPEITFIEDAQRREWPSARVFDDLGDAEMTLIAMSTALVDDELESAVDDAIDAVQEAEHIAADMRDDAYDTDLGRSNLLMGNLHQLPEVGQSLDPNRRNMTCPWCREEDNTYEDEEYTLHCFECGTATDPFDRRDRQERADGNETLVELAADG